MKNLVLIQARYGSTRLPGKIMRDLSGKPELQWVIERVQRSRLIDEIIVITTIEKMDLQVIKFCSELGIRVFAGSEKDVLDRYYQAAKLLHPEYIIRITADCPLFDWRYLDMAITQINENTDYMAEMSESFPDGLDIEIIKYSALEKCWKNARLLSEREHVTMYIKNHPEQFTIQNLECPIPDIGTKRWTLDEKEDYEMIHAIYRYFLAQQKEDFVTEDILAFIEKHPEIENINAGHVRNEGLRKSIANDKIIQIKS